MRGQVDRLMLISLLMLLILGLMALLSASAPRAASQFGDPFYYFKRQLLYLGLGLPLFLLATRVSPVFLRRVTYPLLGLSVFLLLLVLVPGFGVKVGEARRWLSTPFGTFQPSEGAKLALVLFLAKRGVEGDKESLGGFLKPLLVVGVVLGLLLLEPDFSGAIFLGGLSLLLMLSYGWKLSHVLLSCLLSLPLLGVVALSKTYVLKRFIDYWAFLSNPSEGSYQLQQAFIAIARGGIFGVGIGLGKQKLFFLPASHTDFVLANLGEEMGFLGLSLVMGLYGVIFLRGMRIALKHPDAFCSNLATGLTFMLVLQALLNIGVVLGVFPTTGLPLPFMSYGGSCLIASLVAAGLLLNLSRGVGERRWCRR